VSRKLNSNHFKYLAVICLTLTIVVSFNYAAAQSAPSYKFEIWSKPAEEVTAGSVIHIQGKICPPQDTSLPEIGRTIRTYSYITMPNGTRTVEQSLQRTGEYCNVPVPIDLASITPRMVGTWSVYAIANWTAAGGVEERLQSDTVSFKVKEESMFQSSQHEKIAEVSDGTRLGSFDWSPDGKFIVFTLLSSNATNQLGETSTLWMIDSDGKGLRKIDLPMEMNNVYDPRVSPSNEQVLFLGSHAEGASTFFDVFRYDIKKGSLTQVTNTKASDTGIIAFDWLPDGNKIVYSETVTRSNDGQHRLWLADFDGNKIKMLYEGELAFANLDVNPDGKKIVAVDLTPRGQGAEPLSDIVVFDIVKDEIHQHIGDPSSYGCRVIPRWSPNSEFVVYSVAACFPASGGQIRITPVDGSFDEMILGSSSVSIGAAAVSPDGRFIVYGINDANDNGKDRSTDNTGVYKTELGKVIPEFLMAQLMAAISIAGLIVVFSIRKTLSRGNVI